MEFELEFNPKYHIEITNLETGETLQDCDTNAIAGAFATDSKSITRLTYTDCNDIYLEVLAIAAKLAAEDAVQDLPWRVRWNIQRKVRKLWRGIKKSNKKEITP